MEIPSDTSGQRTNGTTTDTKTARKPDIRKGKQPVTIQVIQRGTTRGTVTDIMLGMKTPNHHTVIRHTLITQFILRQQAPSTTGGDVSTCARAAIPFH